MASTRFFFWHIDTDQIQATATHYWRWWLAQLHAMLPSAWRKRLVLQHDNALFYLDPYQHSLVYEGGDDTASRASIALTDDAALSALRQKMGSDAAKSLRVVLPRNAVLSKEIELPWAARENIAQVLAFEMDRHTPFQAADVHYAYRVLDKRQSGQRLRLRLCVVQKTLLSALLKPLMDANIKPLQVLCPHDHDMDLTPAWAGSLPQKNQALRRLTLALLWGTLILAILVTPVWHLRAWVIDLQHYEAVLRTQADAVLELQMRKDTLHALIEDLEQRRPANLFVTHIMEEMALLLPDDVWLQSLRVTKTNLELQGFAGAATSLIQILEASPMLDSVSFRAPVTLDHTTGMERFHIHARLLTE